MKFLYVALVAVLAVHAVSADLKLYPAPWCLCGTCYKLKLDPLKLSFPKVEYGGGDGYGDYKPGLTTLDLSRPACTLCAMKQAFIDKYNNPLDYYGNRPPCGCGCN